MCSNGVWTMAFWLGRKATETQYKWTIYVHGATNDDLGVVIKRAVFQMHPSFNNSVRVVEASPFELSECGWGEFEIVISLFFHNDVCEKQLDLRVLVHLSYVTYFLYYLSVFAETFFPCFCSDD